MLDAFTSQCSTQPCGLVPRCGPLWWRKQSASAASCSTCGAPKAGGESEGGLWGEVWRAQSRRRIRGWAAGRERRAQEAADGAAEALPGNRGRGRGLQEGTAGPVDSSRVELREAQGCSTGQHLQPLLPAERRWRHPGTTQDLQPPLARGGRQHAVLIRAAAREG
eukprot:7386845-Prymnesium_polylepis.1